jgi:hypothetical protein
MSWSGGRRYRWSACSRLHFRLCFRCHSHYFLSVAVHKAG